MEDYSPNSLAYIGDAVIELLVRRHIVRTDPEVKNPTAKASAFVTAVAQSDAVSRIEAFLSDEEVSIYKRARNNYRTSNIPKSASALQYRRSTGFEALFGYLYLAGDESRLEELFKIAYGLE